MPDEVIISIPEPHERNEVPDLLREIARQIEIGAHQGYHPRWILTSADNADSVKLPETGASNGPASDATVWLRARIKDALAAVWDDVPTGVGTSITHLFTVPDARAVLQRWLAETESDGYADMANRALTAGLTDAERGAADALADRLNPNWVYPLVATCAVCRQPLQFDIDPGGTPGRNGDWGADGDYGCITGDDEGCDGHTPVDIRWEPNTEEPSR